MLEPRAIEPTHWDLLVAKVRVDSFNQDLLTLKINQLMESDRVNIAIDLSTTQFFSLAAIKYLVATARNLKARGGQLALVSPSEKTKRHFEIYGSLDDIWIFRGNFDRQAVTQHDLIS